MSVNNTDHRRHAGIAECSMTHTITLIPGDGIGPEVTEAVLRILAATGVSIEWERYQAGVVSFERTGQALPVELVDSIRRNKVALKGPVTTPIGTGSPASTSGCARRSTCTRTCGPVQNLPGVASRFQGVDLVIVRENTEDLYAGLEHEVVPGVVESLKIITARASTRIARVRLPACATARPQESDGHPQGEHHEAQRRAVPRLRARGVARSTRTSSTTRRSSTPTCMQLVLNPTLFDVLLMRESVRRHRLRSLRRAGRRPRRRRRGESRARRSRCSRPFTAARRTSPASCSPIPRRCCCRRS